MLRFRSDASSVLILTRGKARHLSSQGLFAAGPSPASKGLPSTRGEPRPYARRPARPQSHADRQTPPPGVCVTMLTGPPAGGAPSPTLGAGAVRGPRLLPYGLPTSVASFRARETEDEVPSHAVPQIQAFPGLSRRFQSPNVLWFFLLPHSLPGPCSLRIDRVWGFTGLGPPASQALRPCRAPGGGTGLGQRPKGQLRAGRSPGRVEPLGPHPGPSLVTGLGARPAREPPWNWR